MVSKARMKGFKGIAEAKKESQYPPKSVRGADKNSKEYFLETKVNDLANYIDDFNLTELLWYFQFIADSYGYKYVIMNYEKELAIMKAIKANFNNREVCGMIEFLFESEQNYIKKDGLTPSILRSGWVNQIYADFKLWAKDAYEPDAEKKSKKEWKKQKEKIQVGVKI